MLSKESLEAFKKQYKEEYGKNLSDDESLAIALFENAVIHAQNFNSRLKQELGEELDSDTQTKLAEEISSCSLALICIYLSRDKKFDTIHLLVLDEYSKFIKNYSGAENEEQEKAISEFLSDKLRSNIMWLSTPLEEKALIHKIASKVSDIAPSITDKYKPLVERLVREIEKSMEHFGIIN